MAEFVWLIVMTCVVLNVISCQDWNRLSVTFRKFEGMPMDLKKAKEANWQEVDNGCTKQNSKFTGLRMKDAGDSNTGNILIYDTSGQIAGIQMYMPASSVSSSSEMYVYDSIADEPLVFLTAYFVHPDAMCAGDARNSGVGDGLWIQKGPRNGNEIKVEKIPLVEDNLADTTWVKGGCIPGMGMHYWHDITVDMNCLDVTPLFLLFNGKGTLHAFGWINFLAADNKRFEHPPPNPLVLNAFFSKTDPPPKCIFDPPRSPTGITTQHIYLDGDLSNIKKLTCATRG